MELELKRQYLYDKNSVGRLFIDGKDYCFTLEDRLRVLNSEDDKIPGETAIQAGRYQVIVDFSERFQRLMPHLLNVSYFVGIRIHSGNTDKDTEGCILVGETFDPAVATDFIGRSRAVFSEFFHKLEIALALDEQAWITITDEPTVDERTV